VKPDQRDLLVLLTAYRAARYTVEQERRLPALGKTVIITWIKTPEIFMAPKQAQAGERPLI
jgi:hypothetical protein